MSSAQSSFKNTSLASRLTGVKTTQDSRSRAKNESEITLNIRMMKKRMVREAIPDRCERTIASLRSEFARISAWEAAGVTVLTGLQSQFDGGAFQDVSI